MSRWKLSAALLGLWAIVVAGVVVEMANFRSPWGFVAYIVIVAAVLVGGTLWLVPRRTKSRDRDRPLSRSVSASNRAGRRGEIGWGVMRGVGACCRVRGQVRNVTRSPVSSLADAIEEAGGEGVVNAVGPFSAA